MKRGGRKNASPAFIWGAYQYIGQFPWLSTWGMNSMRNDGRRARRTVIPRNSQRDEGISSQNVERQIPPVVPTSPLKTSVKGGKKRLPLGGRLFTFSFS